MRKALVFGVVAALALMVAPAWAYNIGTGQYRVDFTDESCLWSGTTGGVDGNGLLGVQPLSTSLGGTEQRNIFRINEIDRNVVNNEFNLGSPTQLTGVFYDLVIIGQTAITPTHVVLDFGVLGRNPITNDAVTTAGHSSLLGVPQATMAHGGVMEIYEGASKDYSPDPNGVGLLATKIGAGLVAPVNQDAGSGPSTWKTGATGHVVGATPATVNGTVGDADGYASATHDSLWLAAVLVDYAYAVTQGLTNPDASVPITTGTILREDIDLAAGTGRGFASLNIVGGSQGNTIVPNRFGTYLDANIAFGLTLPLEAFNPDFSTEVTAGSFNGPGQWTVDSFDPANFSGFVGIPEPCTMTLLGLGLAGLGLLRRRQK